MPNENVMVITGSFTRFDPITPEQLQEYTENNIDYSELQNRLEGLGLDVQKVIFDASQPFLNAAYCDYEAGVYAMLGPRDLQQQTPVLENLSTFNAKGNSMLKNGNWEMYYGVDHFLMIGPFIEPSTLPVQMRIYDFSRRVRDLPTKKVFSIWHGIYTLISYANGMWSEDVLEYVFQYAPPCAALPLNERGKVTVYRGVGELSLPPEKAISWSTDRASAMYFATHTGRGTGFITAEVAPENIVAYFPSHPEEYEVLVRPGNVEGVQAADMLPATELICQHLTDGLYPDFVKYGMQVKKYGYPKTPTVHDIGMYGVHDESHILRVLMLSLIYWKNSGDELTEADKAVLVYFSLLHDCGRTNDDADESHGRKSVEAISKHSYHVAGLRMGKQDYRLAHTIITLHSVDDAKALRDLESIKYHSKKERMRYFKLFNICKDMDGLDRVRLEDLDYQMLRTEYARRLPLIAGRLLQAGIHHHIEQKNNAN